MDDYLAGISSKKVSDEQQQILCAPVDPDDVEVKPTSFFQAYLSHSKYRERLNKAFGAGGWGMKPVGEPEKRDDYLLQKWTLWAEGRCLDVSVGAQVLGSEEDGMPWEDAIESVKSKALVRCCKAIGVAMECWNRQWIAHFRDNYCVKVWIKDKKQPVWRRKDDQPLYNETGIVAGPSPSQGRAVPDSAHPLGMKDKGTVHENGSRTITPAQEAELIALLKATRKRTPEEFRVLLSQHKIQRTGKILASEFHQYLAWAKGEPIPDGKESPLGMLQEVAGRLGKTPQALAEEWGYPAPERVPPDVLAEIVALEKPGAVL